MWYLRFEPRASGTKASALANWATEALSYKEHNVIISHPGGPQSGLAQIWKRVPTVTRHCFLLHHHHPSPRRRFYRPPARHITGTWGKYTTGPLPHACWRQPSSTWLPRHEENLSAMSRTHGNDDEGTRSDNDEHSDMQPPCPSRQRKGRRLGGRYEGGDVRRGVRSTRDGGDGPAISISGAYAPACHVTHPLTTSEHPPSHQQPPLNPDNHPTSATWTPRHRTNPPPILLTATSPTPTTHDPTNMRHNHRVTSPLPSLRDVGTIYTPAIPPPPTTRRAETAGLSPLSPQSKHVNVGAHERCRPKNASAATNSAHECRRHCQQHPPTPAPLPTSNGHAPTLARLLTKVISGEHLYFSLPNFLFHHIVHVLISLLKYNWFFFSYS